MSLSIFTGRWTDQSKGSILGDQVTLSSTSSNILIAFLAIFVTLVGGFAWTIVAHLFHQLRVSSQPQNGYHHQIQALLRSNVSPTQFAERTLRVGFAWSKHKQARRRIILSAVSLALLALAVNVMFIAAGLFLSLVGTTGDVLLRGSTCGTWRIAGFENLTEVEAVETWLEAWQYGDTAIAQAHEYARSCYASQGNEIFTAATEQISVADCNFYVKPGLNWTTSFPAVCPFGEYCAGPLDTNVIRFDTGYIDSLTDLGLNAASEDSIHFRRVTTCAPINTEPFTTGWVNHSDYGMVAMYDFGKNFVQPGMKPWQHDYNHTFIYSHAEYEAASQAYSLIMASTDVDPVVSNGKETNGFIPDPRLAPENSSVLLMFLANRAYYYALPVEDPWFNATSYLPPNNSLAADTLGGALLWYNPSPGAVLGCVIENELCNPAAGSSNCISWDVRPSSQLGLSTAQLEPLNLSARQMAQLNTLSMTMHLSNMGYIIDTMGANALVAHSYLEEQNSLLSLPLNATQWISELQSMQATTMTIMQASGVSTVLGGSSGQLQRLLVPPTNDAEKWACGIQKIKSSDYRSFSVLGLILIFVIGGIVMLAAILLNLVLPALQRRLKKGRRQRLHWYANELLHLQRIAFEHHKIGNWVGRTIDADKDSIPVTEELETFLSFADVEEPLDSTSEVASSETDTVDEKIAAVSLAEKVSSSNISAQFTQERSSEGVVTRSPYESVVQSQGNNAEKTEESPARLQGPPGFDFLSAIYDGRSSLPISPVSRSHSPAHEFTGQYNLLESDGPDLNLHNPAERFRSRVDN